MWRYVIAASLGWYLMLPGLEQVGAFDTARECEMEKDRRLKRAETIAARLSGLPSPDEVQKLSLQTLVTRSIPQLRAAFCLASDDPRLR